MTPHPKVCTCTRSACFCGRLSLCSGWKRTLNPDCPKHRQTTRKSA